MSTLVEEISNSYSYFLRLSGFPDLLGKVFLLLNPLFDFLSNFFCDSNVNN